MKFVYAVIIDEEYDPDETFDDAELAIELAVIDKKNIAVLDALSLEYYGMI